MRFKDLFLLAALCSLFGAAAQAQPLLVVQPSPTALAVEYTAEAATRHGLLSVAADALKAGHSVQVRHTVTLETRGMFGKTLGSEQRVLQLWFNHFENQYHLRAGEQELVVPALDEAVRLALMVKNMRLNLNTPLRSAESYTLSYEIDVLTQHDTPTEQKNAYRWWQYALLQPYLEQALDLSWMDDKTVWQHEQTYLAR